MPTFEVLARVPLPAPVPTCRSTPRLKLFYRQEDNTLLSFDLRTARLRLQCKVLTVPHDYCVSSGLLSVVM